MSQKKEVLLTTKSFLNVYNIVYLGYEMAGMNVEKNFDFFLNTDFQGYKENEWVAICDQKVVAHGDNLKQVIKKAKDVCGTSRPLFTRVKKIAHYLHA